MVLAQAPNQQERHTPPRSTSTAQQLQERDILHCVRTSLNKVYTRSLCPDTLHAFLKRVPWPTSPPHSLLRRQAIKRRRSSLRSNHVQTDQGTSIQCLRSTAEMNSTNRLCEDEGSFSMRPVLHQNVPNAGCRLVVLSRLGSHLPPGLLNTTAAATTIAHPSDAHGRHNVSWPLPVQPTGPFHTPLSASAHGLPWHCEPPERELHAS